MPPGNKTSAKSKDSSATIGFEGGLGLAAGLAEVGMQEEEPNGRLHPSSFILQTLPHLAQRGIEADFGPEHADTFRRDLDLDLTTLS